MKNTRSTAIVSSRVWALSLGLMAAIPFAWAGEDIKDTVEVKLGVTIERTWDDVKKADYAYGPKQSFNNNTKETHIWLPYGAKGVYYGLIAAKSTDPEPNHPASMENEVDGFACLSWGYKLHFDKPIGAFKLSCSLAELGLVKAVAGIEYSTDGQKWTTLKQVENKSGNVQPFAKADEAKASGLKSQDLYIRFYSRKEGDTDATQAEGAFFKLWTAGDPTWGDASTTFFDIQPQLWVKAAE